MSKLQTCTSIDEALASEGAYDLNLYESKVSAAELRRLGESERATSMTRLTLCRSKVGAAAVVEFLGCGRLSGLTFLDLRDKKVGTKGAAAIAAATELHGALQELWLSGTRVGDKGVAALVGAGLPVLRRLTLQNAGLTDASARAVAAAGWPAIKEIDLGFNDIGDLVADELTGSASLPKGTRIRVEGTGIEHMFDVSELVVGQPI